MVVAAFGIAACGGDHWLDKARELDSYVSISIRKAPMLLQSAIIFILAPPPKCPLRVNSRTLEPLPVTKRHSGAT
jgi:hypothetical protein